MLTKKGLSLLLSSLFWRSRNIRPCLVSKAWEGKMGDPTVPNTIPVQGLRSVLPTGRYGQKGSPQYGNCSKKHPYQQRMHYPQPVNAESQAASLTNQKEWMVKWGDSGLFLLPFVQLQASKLKDVRRNSQTKLSLSLFPQTWLLQWRDDELWSKYKTET